MATKNRYQMIVPFIIFILALFLLFKLVRPMITILLSSVILAYISFPLYKKIFKKIPYQSLSIILSLLIVVIIILIPLSFLALGIMQQGYLFYDSLSGNIAKGALFGFGCVSKDSEVCLYLNQAEKFSLEQLSKWGLDQQLQKFMPVLDEKITNFIWDIPLIIAQIFLTLVITYFILRRWKIILKKIVDLLPLRTKTKERLIKEFKNITQSVVYAQLLVALAQGIVGVIGFYIFGVPFPILLGMALAFCSLIPAIGTALIWVPASLFMILSGYFYSDYWMLGQGIGLFLYGLLVISTIDNILLAKIVHTKAKVSQIVIMVGVIGGASLFGIVGIFIGPILLPLLITYFETFKQRFA